MSRIIVYDLGNNAVDSFEAVCNRGWILLGNTGVDGGGGTTVVIPNDVALKPHLQLGRMVLIERPPLPAWAGVIDTPWIGSAPVQLTLYNVEYLLSLRSAEQSVAVVGPLPSTIYEMIQIANRQQPLYIAPGNGYQVQDQFPRVIEQGIIWDQMIELLENSGYELILRPQRDIQNRLTIYADVGVGLGVNTNFLLEDGERGNMKVIEATINGKIINRVKGVSGTTTEEDQLQSDVREDLASQNIYRTRSEVVQFQNVTQLSTLELYAQTYLNNVGRPYLDLTVDVRDEGDAFAHLRVGNLTTAHASNIFLPGGIHGWRGSTRILAMAFDETSNTVRTTLRGLL